MNFPLRRPGRWPLWVVLCLLAAGCAGPRPSGSPVADEAKAVYTGFLANQNQEAKAPAYSLSGSMSFANKGKSGRLNYRFFGNLAGPSRLDLNTAVGGPFAYLREDASEFSAFLPGKDTLYRHADTRSGAARLGMPLPFSLREMAALATGRLGELAPAKYGAAKKVADGFEYSFGADPRLSSLTLDFAGKPRHLTGRGVEPWRVDFDDDEAVPGQAAPVARRLTLTTPGGASLVIRVKSLQLRPAPYPAADLELPIPAHAATRTLDGPGSESLLPDL